MNSEADQPAARKKGHSKYRYWNLLFYWTDNTTLHGVQYIGERDTFRVRRYIWLIVTLTAVAYFTKYIVDRIQHFASNPVSVNVQIKDQASLAFPTVTLCNQNVFSLSKSVEAGFYYAIAHAYGKVKGKRESLSPEFANVYNLSMDQIYHKAGYNLHDMLLECSWYGEPCSHDDFTPIITDHGLCYSFNAKGPPLTVSDTGATNGLKVVMNIEQYNYMPGPFQSAGVRLNLHHRDVIPMVTDLGQSVSVGKHTFVAMKMIQSESLEPPFGKCGSSFKYPNTNYSEINCIIICRMHFYRDRCGCREAHMLGFNLGGDNDGDIPICSFYQQLTCIAEESKRFNMIQRDSCNCPISCSESIFDPSLSFNTLSLLSRTNLYGKRKDTLHILQQQLMKGLDYRSIIESEVYAMDREFFTNLLSSYQIQKELNFVKIPQEFNATWMAYQEELAKMESLISLKTKLLNEQKMVVQELFIRGFESADERTFALVDHEMFELQYLSRIYHSQLASPTTTNSKSMRELYIFRAINMLQNKKRCVEAAKDKIDELKECYTNSTPYFNYFPNHPHHNWTQGMAAIPRKTLYEAIHSKADTVLLLNETKEHLNVMSKTLQQLVDIFQRTFTTGQTNTGAVDQLLSDLVNCSNEWINDRVFILPKIFRQPLLELDKKLSEAKKWMEFLKDFRKSLDAEFAQVKYTLNDATKEENITKALSEMIEGYLQADTKHVNISSLIYRKSHLANFLVKIERDITDQASRYRRVTEKMCFHRFRMRRGLRVFKVVAVNIWQNLYQDTTAYAQYKYHNVADMLRLSDNLEIIRINVSEAYETLVEKLSLLCHIDQQNIDMMRRLTEILKVAQKYKDRMEINFKYFSENIVTISIFYRELNIETVKQQEAYEFDALLGDLGGQMGLFLGASILSLAEILDLIIQVIVQTKHQRNGTYDYDNDRIIISPSNKNKNKEKTADSKENNGESQPMVKSDREPYKYEDPHTFSV